MKTAIITGITGQDGSYLAELLLSKGYRVYGILRRSSTPHTQRIKHLMGNPDFILRQGDVTDKSSIERVIFEAKPDEFYNLAAQSFVPASWTNPEFTAEATGLGVLRCLEALRYYEEYSGKKVRFYQAGSSEQFGKVKQIPQNEETPFYPRSPYGVAKCFGYEITRNYRESYGMFAVTGLLFNHESPRRGLEFVTRKITSTIAKIKNGEDIVLELGNIYSKRDWGFAGDYVKAMHLMLQQKEPKDYVIATGEEHTIKEFASLVCECAGIKIKWVGEGMDEKAMDETGKTIMAINKEYYRPAEVETLLGDSSKARQELGWKIETSFAELVEMMAEEDIKRVKNNDLNY
ncbi:MAG: GDP-mannose 4,6-dehydratase [Candidatus Nanoarchaeia archaeon]|nr:GDP-mannose 4,6-dehydratase [Candidatus Nanoarchaeia archaeon]MDD5053861.1 GDP-mannose 4,6-dehydratase [Candidatus Nanoarchaeia archaeon]MDD5499663.1 GDP-mannose 4,6-dehydratase [Candidatus Nanoarchaeia archaeon]